MQYYSPILAACPLFLGMTPDDITEALTVLEAHTEAYPGGSFIRLTGDPADSLGIVLSGSVQVLRDSTDGDRSITARLEPGDLFAEVFVCAGTKTLPVDIMADTDTVVLLIPHKNLFSPATALGEHRAMLIQNLLRITARKALILNRKLQYTTCRTTREKLLCYLFDCSREAGSREFSIPFNRRELADYLGVDRSAMSTELGKLVREGILETQRSRFKLLR